MVITGDYTLHLPQKNTPKDHEHRYYTYSPDSIRESSRQLNDRLDKIEDRLKRMEQKLGVAT